MLQKFLLIRKNSEEELEIAVFVAVTEIQGCLNKLCDCSQYLAKGLQLNIHVGGENTFDLLGFHPYLKDWSGYSKTIRFNSILILSVFSWIYS